MIELRNFSRTGEIEIPAWAHSLGARPLPDAESRRRSRVASRMSVPLIDTTIYLDYLARRFARGGGEIHSGIHFNKLEDVDSGFDLVINCAGIGAKTLAADSGSWNRIADRLRSFLNSISPTRSFVTMRRSCTPFRARTIVSSVAPTT